MKIELRRVERYDGGRYVVQFGADYAGGPKGGFLRVSLQNEGFDLEATLMSVELYEGIDALIRDVLELQRVPTNGQPDPLV